MPFKTIQQITKIDKWFLNQINELVLLEKEAQNYNLESLPKHTLKLMKEKGYADRQIAHLLGCLESEIFNKRIDLKIKRNYKLVDTCAAEFEAATPYYYSTFGDENESKSSDKEKVIVIGSGPNRIGQGI